MAHGEATSTSETAHWHQCGEDAARGTQSRIPFMYRLPAQSQIRESSSDLLDVAENDGAVGITPHKVRASTVEWYPKRAELRIDPQCHYGSGTPSAEQTDPTVRATRAIPRIRTEPSKGLLPSIN